MEDNNISNYCNNLGNTLVIFSALLAILISKDLSIDDQNLLSSLLQALGENISLIAGVQEICDKKIMT